VCLPVVVSATAMRCGYTTSSYRRRIRWRILIKQYADGATSTALATHVLRSIGVDASYLVPNRFEYGYGLSAEIVAVALQSAPDLILTVDNGVASNEGVEKAVSSGVTVVVTDH